MNQSSSSKKIDDKFLLCFAILQSEKNECQKKWDISKKPTKHAECIGKAVQKYTVCKDFFDKNSLD